MLNADRIEEIRREIRRVEEEQEEVNLYFAKLLREEDDAYEEINNYARNIAAEFEACHRDPRLTALIEEKFNQIVVAQSCCANLSEELKYDQKKINSDCESYIEELRREMQTLEKLEAVV